MNDAEITKRGEQVHKHTARGLDTALGEALRKYANQSDIDDVSIGAYALSKLLTDVVFMCKGVHAPDANVRSIVDRALKIWEIGGGRDAFKN